MFIKDKWWTVTIKRDISSCIKQLEYRGTIYNYCLHMRWTSKYVKPSRKTTSRGLTTWCSPHMKAVTVLLYRNYSKMFITWMFCFVEDNKIISSLENFIKKKKKKKDFNTPPVVMGCLPLHYICLGCSPGCLPCQQIFHKTSKL